MGKSTLAAKLVREIEPEFEVVVWRSLQNAPPFEEWLESVLPVLLRALGEDIALPNSLDAKMLKLMEGLRSARCLLILDNAEDDPQCWDKPDNIDRVMRATVNCSRRLAR